MKLWQKPSRKLWRETTAGTRGTNLLLHKFVCKKPPQEAAGSCGRNPRQKAAAGSCGRNLRLPNLYTYPFCYLSACMCGCVYAAIYILDYDLSVDACGIPGINEVMKWSNYFPYIASLSFAGTTLIPFPYADKRERQKRAHFEAYNTLLNSENYLYSC